MTRVLIATLLASLPSMADPVKIVKTDSQIDSVDPGIRLAVRSKMAEQGMAAIICLTSGAQYRMAHVRYLTQLDDGEEDTAVVFPLEGEPTVWSGREGNWPSANWVSGIRGREGRFWGRNVGARLKELGLGGATIGVAGLKGSKLADARNPEGQTGYGAMMAVQEQVPKARLVDATQLLGECR